MHSKDQLQGRAARTISMMVLWTSSHVPRADGKISMPSCGTELEHCCNPALARCSNLASRSCKPRTANAMKSTASSSKSFGLHVLTIGRSSALFRISVRCFVSFHFFSLQAPSKKKRLYYIPKPSFQKVLSIASFSKSLPHCVDVLSNVCSVFLCMFHLYVV